ncbi:MAG: hypothetical protein M1277_01060 [Patescibacteria group bacterium]|nr:hypothetical protein [Patescibacteria group bacterium]
MLKLKSIIPAVLGGFFLFLLFSTQALAGGGPVSFTVDPNTSLNPGEEYVVHAQVYANGPYPTYCKNCSIHLELKFPQDGDYIAQSSDRTDNNGTVYAKVISRVPGERVILATGIETPDGVSITSNSYAVLNYTGTSAWVSPQPTNTAVSSAPEMVYPVDGQTLDLEGAYMFKVKPIAGATGYLFGLFQDGVMTYENYRDTGTLSANGEFALWPDNPAHAKFHTGAVTVMVRALVNNQWTDARQITIYLEPRNGPVTVPAGQASSILPAVMPVLPTIEPQTKIVVVTDASASAALQKKINNLQKEVNKTKQKQAETESKLNLIISWLKSFFHSFKL